MQGPSQIWEEIAKLPNIDIQNGRQTWPLGTFNIEKGQMLLHIFILLDNTNIFTYWLSKSDELWLTAAEEVFQN